MNEDASMQIRLYQEILEGFLVEVVKKSIYWVLRQQWLEHQAASLEGLAQKVELFTDLKGFK